MITEKESEFLRQLGTLYQVRRLSQKTLAGYELSLYLVDLSGWRLRFSNRTPLIWVKAEAVEHVSARELTESLQDVAREHGWHHRECMVLLDGNGGELKTQIADQHFPRFVILDAADQRSILTTSSFTSALLDLVCKQLPISSLAPYQISAPVEGTGFFGRQSEISNVLGHSETNFTIAGVRRIGKTSLLREVKRQMLEQGEDPRRTVWLDCSTLSDSDQFIEGTRSQGVERVA